ncbi:hypothetical protein FNV43_RR23578 [Rhamnella rubrinervis]|uniref:Uncharacterized protein n=1 Tax=Rhamnella rubrinervis TaxID=2594499 RepID=A0A8K0DXD6_9ROSA|nr:hypothetical protein FNV43_RR23578 [Rhamnella rubrinervis]
MGFIWFFVYTHLLSILLVSCDSNVDVTQSFIVRVQNDLKQSGYFAVEDWYRSTIKSLNASQNPNISNSEESDFLHVYNTVFQGFSLKLTTLQAEELKKRPEILGVFPDRVRQIQTTRSPGFLGLEASGNNGLLNESDWGSNTIIGVIDTGIWPERSSFHDQDLGPIPSHWKGECVPGQQFPKTLCNKKLIGARYFHKGYVARFGGAGDNNREKVLFESARDSLGHGTHTVSTAAGRRVENASLLGYAQGTSSGIAPKARIAVYKVCWSEGCMESDILAAMDYAVKDGVDVISLSLGGGPLPYDVDAIAIASYVAVKKGIVVSAAAGNKVPSAETVTNVAPWITTVGAGTLDRNFPADLTLEDGRVITGSSLYSGDPLPEKTYYPLIYAGDASVVGSKASAAAYCMPRTLDKELVRGKIVVCDVGQISSVGKGVVVKESGGVGVITAYVDPFGEGLLADAYLTPGMSITVSARSTVLDYIISSKDPRATIRFTGPD